MTDGAKTSALWCHYYCHHHHHHDLTHLKIIMMLFEWSSLTLVNNNHVCRKIASDIGQQNHWQSIKRALFAAHFSTSDTTLNYVAMLRQSGRIVANRQNNRYILATIVAIGHLFKYWLIPGDGKVQLVNSPTVRFSSLLLLIIK